MKKFHILFKHNKEDFTSIGINVDAVDAHHALIEFNSKYPRVYFLCMYDLEEFSHLRR